MKNLFSFDVRTGDTPYNKYVINRSDETVFEQQTETLKKLKEFGKKYSLPSYFKIIMYLSGIAAAIIFFGVIKSLIDGISLSEAYKNAPNFFYIFGVCVIIFILLFAISRYLLKKGDKDPEFKVIASELENVVIATFSGLGVPQTAEEISVVASFFKVNKKGKEKPVSVLMKYNVHEMRIYADEDRLYFADMDGVTAIPFSEISEITENKKRVQFPEWTKRESPRSKKYKPYKVRAFQYGYTVKTYSMQIVKDGEELEVIVPNYELETLKNFVSVPVIELKRKKKKSKDCQC